MSFVKVTISEVETQSIPHSKVLASDLTREVRLDYILHSYCECLKVPNTK